MPSYEMITAYDAASLNIKYCSIKLTKDDTMKVHGMLLALACLSTSAFAHENGTIKIYDASHLPQIISMLRKGRLVMEDGKGTLAPKTAKILNKNLEQTRDFYAEEFNLKSYDNKGAVIEASVNVNRLTVVDLLGSKQNAAWMGNGINRFIFGAGSKKGLDNFEKALDVVAHEFTHAVIDQSSKLEYKGQSGALNEHFADVFGVIINAKINNPSNPYMIGSSIIYGEYAQKAKALRDMMDPSKGLSPQPSHLKQVTTPGAAYSKYDTSCVASRDNDNCGVHVLSGIPNKASALIMSAIGFDESAKLFYNVMTKGMKANSNFKDYRVALMNECENLSSDTCSIVDDALKSVGL